MQNMTAGAAIAEVIARQGVEQVFVVPGESFLTVLDGLFDKSAVNVVTARHEGGASFMALGYAVASGRTGVCFAQRGPGAANLSIGLHCASQDSVPIVAFVSQVPMTSIGREAHQEVDLPQMLAPHCKMVMSITDPARAAEITGPAFQIAVEGRAGVVAVVMPSDVVKARASFSFSSPSSPSCPGLPQEDAASILQMVRAARFPALLVGGGVRRAGAGTDVMKLAAQLEVPVLSWRRGVVADDDVRRVDLAGSRSREHLDQVDLFLVVGTRLHEDASLLYSVPPRGTPWIHIDLSPGVSYSPEPPALSIVADARRAITALSAELERAPIAEETRAERHLRILEWRSSEAADSEIPEPHEASPLHPDRVASALAQALGHDVVVSVDVGNFVFWIRRHWRNRPASLFIESAAGSMGTGFSMALGAQLAQPGKHVVAIAGDGGFMMSLPELETAVRYGLPVVCIIFNNNNYGTIRWQQEIAFPGRSIATQISNPDFASVARAFGANGTRVSDIEALMKALGAAMSVPGPSIIEVMVDPDEFVPGVSMDGLRRAAG